MWRVLRHKQMHPRVLRAKQLEGIFQAQALESIAVDSQDFVSLRQSSVPVSRRQSCERVFRREVLTKESVFVREGEESEEGGK